MKRTTAIPLLYRVPLRPNAETVAEHAGALRRYSGFPIVPINTDFGFPQVLDEYEFPGIVAHYSYFANWHEAEFYGWLERQRSALKVAFSQDEYRDTGRLRFFDRFGFDCVFSLLEPQWHETVYARHTKVRRIETTLPGYVSEDLVRAAAQRERPDQERRIDVGYRARQLPYYMGRGAQEKHLIAIEFERRAAGTGLVLDVDATEQSRLYGSDWYDFLANCKGVLGVEAGTSIFDIDGAIERRCEEYLKARPRATFEEVYGLLLEPYEDRIHYRTISPRHFEAAAFGCVQVLFEGRYSGVLRPEEHYIPLKKDFTNFDEVVKTLRDRGRRDELRQRTREDLIESGKYSYERFVRQQFDGVLMDEGLSRSADVAAGELMAEIEAYEATRSAWRRRTDLLLRIYHSLPGRTHLRRGARALGLRWHHIAGTAPARRTPRERPRSRPSRD